MASLSPIGVWIFDDFCGVESVAVKTKELGRHGWRRAGRSRRDRGYERVLTHLAHVVIQPLLVPSHHCLCVEREAPQAPYSE